MKSYHITLLGDEVGVHSTDDSRNYTWKYFVSNAMTVFEFLSDCGRKARGQRWLNVSKIGCRIPWILGVRLGFSRKSRVRYGGGGGGASMFLFF